MPIFLSWNAIFQFVIFWSVLFIILRPVGHYLTRVYSDQTLWLEKVVGRVETRFYQLSSINILKEMSWQQYAFSLVCFNAFGFILLFLMLTCQAYLPLNPQDLPNLPADLAFNVSASFITNTNWQSYLPETTLSYFSQVVGLCVQQFTSASCGMCVAVVLIRSLSRKNNQWVGNFWSDLFRGIIYILLPLAIILAFLLVHQGVIQNFSPFQSIETPLQTSTIIPGGPVASFVAIKQLGSSGGGFFNANAAHPFENPTLFSSLLQMLGIILLPAAFFIMFGKLINDKRQAWSLLGCMMLIFIGLNWFSFSMETQTLPFFKHLNIENIPSLEGKEMRFGIFHSVFWTNLTTATSNGSLNSNLDPYQPLSILSFLFFMQLSESIFGGVGTGLYQMLLFVFLTVFIAGLMIGRTPEYLGKKIQSYEIKMTMLALLIPSFLILIGSALTLLHVQNSYPSTTPHLITQILYAFTSCANNNGSGFSGLNTNTPYYNLVLGLVMLIGRFWVMTCILAIAGSLVNKNKITPSSGTLATHRPLFLMLLICVIFLISLLTHIPFLVLGPVIEHLSLYHA